MLNPRMCPRILRVCAFLSLLAAFVGLPEHAHAQVLLSASKKLCDQAPNFDAVSCIPVHLVPPNQGIAWVVTVQNLTPGPANITVSETYPSNFTQAGAMNCISSVPGSVPFAFPFPSVTLLNVAQQEIFTCTIEGYFTNPSGGSLSQKNTAHITSGNYNDDQSYTVTVDPSRPLNADLEVTKSAAWSGQPAPLDLTSPPGTITYTIVLTNHGPAPLYNLGTFFKLHDTLALPTPQSVPLIAKLTISQCVHKDANLNTVNGDCLNMPLFQPPFIVGTTAPQLLFDADFAGQPGNLAVGDTVVLIYTVALRPLLGQSCVKAVLADGITNNVHFDLQFTNGVTLSEIDPSNNFSNPITVPVETGFIVIDPNCGGLGPLTLTKTQVLPNPPTGFPWGTQVAYNITISASTLPVTGVLVEDFVIEGLGTPPFTRTFGYAKRLPSPGPVGIQSPQKNYTYYLESDLAWKLPSTFIVPFQPQHYQLALTYSNPDCSAVPVIGPEPIWNMVKITYTFASVQYVQVALVQTLMAPRPACKFVTTKTPGSPLQFGPAQTFGAAQTYNVTFTNNGGPRKIGTVIDAVRITDPNYSLGLLFQSSWTCSASPGVIMLSSPGSPLTGTLNGTAVFTASPAQGAVLLRWTNAVFPQFGKLTCSVAIKVARPPYSSALCSSAPAFLENLALMDVSETYNGNVPFPPSGSATSYHTGNPSDPTPTQNLNWATAASLLPKCFDLIVNKFASVAGNTNSPWTFAGGPPVDYDIAVTNPTHSNLTGTAGAVWDGATVSDSAILTPSPSLTPNVIPGSPLCSAQLGGPPFVCAFAPSPLAATTLIGLQSLSAQVTGHWNLRLNQGPVQLVANRVIHNCATVGASGAFTGPYWYSNYNPATPPQACRDVPVLPTTTLAVIKEVTNLTQRPIAAGTTYLVLVTCTPYASIPSSLSLVPGIPQSVVVPTVANESCTVSEPAVSLPPPPDGCDVSAPKLGPGFWEAPAIFPGAPVSIVAPGPYSVRVVNVAACRLPHDPPGKYGTVSVDKQVIGPQGTVPTTAFPITVVCPGQPLPSKNLTANTSNTWLVLANSACTVVETLPSPPTFTSPNCPGKGLATWLPPVYSPSANVTIHPDSASFVAVTNRYVCGQTGAMRVVKQMIGPLPPPFITVAINVDCGGNITPMLLGNNSGQGITDASGTSCTVSETLPAPFPVPTKFCPSGIAVWQPPTYVPAPTVVLSATTSLTVTVRNTFACK